MEGEVITKGAGLLVFGLFFLWRAVDGWKTRREFGITTLGNAALKTSDASPSPPTKWDRAMATIQPILMLIFGMVMIGLAVVVLFT